MRTFGSTRPSTLAVIQAEFGRSGFWFLACVGAWFLWVPASSLVTGQHLSPWSPYLVTPVVLVLGSLVGIWLAQCWAQTKHAASVVVALAISTYAVPIYANASAAVGALLLALAFIAYLEAIPSSEPAVVLKLEGVAVQGERHKQQVLALGIGAVGFPMCFGSQAVLALIVPFLFLSFL